MSHPIFFLAADMAEACARAGLSAKTSSAIRQAVYAGRLRPTGFSPRAVSIWTVEDAQREILRLVEADAMKREAFEMGRASGRGERQGDLFGGEERR